MTSQTATTLYLVQLDRCIFGIATECGSVLKTFRSENPRMGTALSIASKLVGGFVRLVSDILTACPWGRDDFYTAITSDEDGNRWERAQALVSG